MFKRLGHAFAEFSNRFWAVFSECVEWPFFQFVEKLLVPLGFVSALGVLANFRVAIAIVAFVVIILLLMALARREAVIRDLGGLALTSLVHAQRFKKHTEVAILHKRLHWFIRGNDCLFRIEDIQVRNVGQELISVFTEGASADSSITPQQLCARFTQSSPAIYTAVRCAEVTAVGESSGMNYRLAFPFDQPVPTGAIFTLKHWWSWPGCFGREQEYIYILEDYKGGTNKLEVYITFVNQTVRQVCLFARRNRLESELKREQRIIALNIEKHEAAVRESLKGVADGPFIEECVRTGRTYSFVRAALDHYMGIILFRR